LCCSLCILKIDYAPTNPRVGCGKGLGDCLMFMFFGVQIVDWFYGPFTDRRGVSKKGIFPDSLSWEGTGGENEYMLGSVLIEANSGYLRVFLNGESAGQKKRGDV